MACLYYRWVLYSIQKDFFMSAIFTKDFFTHMYRRKNFVPRLLLVLFAVILMGFCLSWLVLCDMGTDPCTMMNLAISDKLGMAIGDWQALMNIVLLIFVIIWRTKLRLWNTCQHVSCWLLSAVFLLALGNCSPGWCCHRWRFYFHDSAHLCTVSFADLLYFRSCTLYGC